METRGSRAEGILGWASRLDLVRMLVVAGMFITSCVVAVSAVLGLGGSGGDSDEADTPVPADEAVEATAEPIPVVPGNEDPRFQEVHHRLAAMVEERGLNGAAYVIVDRDNGIVFQDYAGEFSEDRASLLASESKMVTAGVLLNLEDQGLIDLDQPIVEYVDWADGANAGVTAAHLISNSSGIPGFHRNGFPPNHEALIEDGFGDSVFTDNAYDCARDPLTTLTDCGSQVMNRHFETIGISGDTAHSTMMPGAEPGAVFRYGGSPWQVAGAVAEYVSGKPWHQLIEETYVERCGTHSLGFANHWSTTDGHTYPEHFDPAASEPTANPHLEGGLYATAPDMAELLMMNLRGGQCAGGQVLSPEAVSKAHTNRTADTGSDYGLGWWTIPQPDGSTRSFINGLYGSNAFIDLDKGYGAQLVIESGHPHGVEMGDELMALVDQVYIDEPGGR